MEFQEAKQKYLQTWGSLASQWGINRTMAQIHALLLVSTVPLSTEQIMEELQVSRGNTNMNVRDLMNWGIVEKTLISGDRKEYFVAKKDIWELFKQITKERRKREIDPMINTLEELKSVNTDTPEGKEFVKVVSDISKVTQKLNSIIDMAMKSDEHWLTGSIMDLLKK